MAFSLDGLTPTPVMPRRGARVEGGWKESDWSVEEEGVEGVDSGAQVGAKDHTHTEVDDDGGGERGTLMRREADGRGECRRRRRRRKG